MIEVLTSFCARLYGRRSAKNKAKKAIEAIHECTHINIPGKDCGIGRG
jgi:hypothetical protein